MNMVTAYFAINPSALFWLFQIGVLLGILRLLQYLRENKQLDKRFSKLPPDFAKRFSNAGKARPEKTSMASDQIRDAHTQCQEKAP
jgi:hypothetical protein